MLPPRTLALVLCAWALGVGCGAPATRDVDLGALLPVARVQTETPRIDFGTPEARSHLLSGWGDDRAAGPGRRFVWSDGPASTLAVVVIEPRPLRIVLRCWPLTFPEAPPQRLEIRVGTRSIGAFELQPGPTSYAIDLPADALAPGENRIGFHYAWTRRPRDVLPGATDHRERAVACGSLEIPDARPGAAPRLEADALRIPPETRVAFHVMAAEGGVLHWSGVGSGAADARLEVEIRRAGDAEARRASLTPGGAGSLELPDPGPEPLRIALWATGAEVSLESPRLRLPIEPEVAAPAPGGTRPDLVVYLVDTLRRDHVGVYGHSRPITPRIDAFAADATVFLDAVAEAPWTRPSVASLFTGLDARGHGVTRPRTALPEGVPLLAERLREAGYATAAVVTNGSVSQNFGFDRGFDFFRYLREDDRPEFHQLSDRANEVALGWLARRPPAQPFFLYVHTTDPHSPYVPPEAWRERFAAGIEDRGIGSLKHVREVSKGGDLDPRTPRQLRALYEAEVAFNDELFGRFLDALRERDLYDRSVIVLLSDHGEAFADHGNFQHGTTLYREELDIPLIVRLPGGRGAGRAVEGLVGQSDLFPTLLELAGVAPGPDLDGRSLLPAVEGDAAPDAEEFAISHLERTRGEWESVQSRHYKLIRTRPREGGGERLWLYDLRADPREADNLVASRPIWRDYLTSLLDARALRASGQSADAESLDPEVQRRLEELGYL